jgi:hypothetical protein
MKMPGLMLQLGHGRFLTYHSHFNSIIPPVNNTQGRAHGSDGHSRKSHRGHRPAHVGFVLLVLLAQVSLRVLQFSPFSTFPPLLHTRSLSPYILATDSVVKQHTRHFTRQSLG